MVRVADLSEPNGRTLFKKECSTSLELLATSPAGHIRFARAKQQINNSEYVAEAKLRRLCPEPQAKGVSPQGDVNKFYSSADGAD